MNTGQEKERPATRGKRLAAIRGCRLRHGATTRQTSCIRRLLEHIELCSDESGSKARQVTLAARLGIGERTLRRWFAEAVSEGLLEVNDSFTVHGRRRTINIVWQRVLAGPPIEHQLFLPFDVDQGGQDGLSHPAKMASSNNKELNPTELIPSQSPGTEPAAEQIPTPTAVSEELGEEEARELLVARGIQYPQGLCRRWRQNRVAGWQVLAVLRFYDQTRAFGPGALYNRLASLDARDTAETRYAGNLEAWLAANPGLWPTPKRARQELPTAQPTTEPLPNLAVERARARREWETYKRQARASFGFFWDALSVAERLALVERHAGKFSAELLARRRDTTSAAWCPSDVAWLERAAADLLLTSKAR